MQNLKVFIQICFGRKEDLIMFLTLCTYRSSITVEFIYVRVNVVLRACLMLFNVKVDCMRNYVCNTKVNKGDKNWQSLLVSYVWKMI